MLCDLDKLGYDMYDDDTYWLVRYDARYYRRIKRPCFEWIINENINQMSCKLIVN